jgi:hypothetical protein
MEVFVENLPRLGALLTLIIGLVGFFKPGLIAGGVGLVMDGPEAVSEIRGAIGGTHLGVSLFAIVANEPMVYIAMGTGWLFVTLARFYSLWADGMTLRGSVPALVIDLGLCSLFYSGFLL